MTSSSILAEKEFEDEYSSEQPAIKTRDLFNYDQLSERKHDSNYFSDNDLDNDYNLILTNNNDESDENYNKYESVFDESDLITDDMESQKNKKENEDSFHDAIKNYGADNDKRDLMELIQLKNQDNTLDDLDGDYNDDDELVEDEENDILSLTQNDKGIL